MESISVIENACLVAEEQQCAHTLGLRATSLNLAAQSSAIVMSEFKSVGQPNTSSGVCHVCPLEEST